MVKYLSSELPEICCNILASLQCIRGCCLKTVCTASKECIVFIPLNWDNLISLNKTEIWDIWGFHSSAYEDYCLLGCDSVQCGREGWFWGWRQNFSLKCECISTKPHRHTSYKTVISNSEENKINPERKTCRARNPYLHSNYIKKHHIVLTMVKCTIFWHVASCGLM
jgi:hypothetical protein